MHLPLCCPWWFLPVVALSNNFYTNNLHLTYTPTHSCICCYPINCHVWLRGWLHHYLHGGSKVTQHKVNQICCTLVDADQGNIRPPPTLLAFSLILPILEFNSYSFLPSLTLKTSPKPFLEPPQKTSPVLACTETLIIGNLLVVTTNSMDCRSFTAGKKFDATEVPELQDILPPNNSEDPTHKLVKISACFPIPFGCHIVQGPINDQTTMGVLNRILASSWYFWLMSTQSWSANLQEIVLQSDAANHSFQNSPKIKLGQYHPLEPLAEVITEHIEAL